MAAPKGNNNAAKGRELSKLLQKRLSDRKKATELMDALLDKALGGDMAAIKEVFDRIDGRALQSIDVAAEVSTRTVKEMSDDELAEIASRSS